MLVAHADALEAVDGEDFLQQVFLDGLHTEDTEQVMRIDGTFSQFIAGFHMIAFGNLQTGTVSDLIGLGVLGILVGGDDQFAALLGFLDGNRTGDFRQDGITLRLAGFEQFLDAGKTLGDVVSARDTAGMEGTHGQLGTGLTDGLGSDDADCFADIDLAAVRHVLAVAAGTYAVFGTAGEDGTDGCLCDAAGKISRAIL